VREPVLSDSIKKGGSVRSLLVAAAFVTAGFSTAAARDVITIGHATFDFDAPSSPLTAGQQAFFRQYKDAVNQHDEASLMALQDASMNSCAVVLRTSILQDLDKTIPDNAKVRFFDATEDIAKEMGFGDLAYLSAQPTAVLGIIGGTKSEREVKMVMILRPVRQREEAFALVPYCLTEKGKALLEQKNGTKR
jgi:hypothetical protein